MSQTAGAWFGTFFRQAVAVILWVLFPAWCPGFSDWSVHHGPGNYDLSVEGLALIEPPARARVLWRLDYPLGVQKTKEATEGEFYGGTAGVITGGGLVFTSSFRPSGDVLNEITKNRYYPLEKQPRSLRQIDGDDVTIAVDAENGRLVWEAVEKGRGMNFLFGKRDHYGVSPAYGEGRVFSWGALGVIYAYDAATGRKVWEASVDPFHGKAVQAKEKALADRAILNMDGGSPHFENLKTGLVCVDGVLVAPDGTDGLVGFATGSGEKKWQIPQVIARGATPALWKHEGRAYLLCPQGKKDKGRVSLIDPQDGRVLWTHEEKGPAHTSLVVVDNRVLINTAGNMANGKDGPQGDALAGLGRFGCYGLSLAGLQLRWLLDDLPENRHPVRPDRGMNRRMAIRDGVGYLLIGQNQRLTSVDMATGKIIQRGEEDLPGTATSPVLVEDRLFLPLDHAHSWDGVALAMYGLQPGGRFQRLGAIHLAKDLGLLVPTDYEIALEFAWRGGVFFTKTRQGLAAIDMRK